MKIGFIGAGNMGGAIIRGMSAAGFRGSDLLVYDLDAGKLAALFEECGIYVCASAEQVIEGTDAVVLGLKPQVLPAAIPPLADAFAKYRPLVISIAAGKTLADLAALLGHGLPIIRVMPNINAKVGEAMSAFCANGLVNAEHKALARKIFEAVGEVIELEEAHFSAFTAIAGCSPAFTQLYVDALAAAGVRLGLPKALSLKIAAQTVLGTVRLLQETGEHPRVLIDQVCSPGGTTIEGLAALVDKGFEAAVMAAVQASYEKDKSL